MKKFNSIVLLLVFCISLFSSTLALAGDGVISFLPIGADKMREDGMVPPKPFFISPTFFYMENYMNVTDIDAYGNFAGDRIKADVEMKNVSQNSTTFGVRFGFFLLPVWQIFGMYFRSAGYTTFDASTGRVCANPLVTSCPDDIDAILPRGYNINQKLKFNADTYGIGTNIAYGYNLGVVIPFLSLNGNYAWSKPDLVDQIIGTVVAGIRAGVAVPLPEKLRMAVWVGGMYQKTIQSNQVGGKYKVHLTGDDLRGGSLYPTYGEDGLDVVSDYTATQAPLSEWTMVSGVSFSPCEYFDLNVEVGYITKLQVNVSMNFNF